ncbi:hypothetical protein KPATCC21470_1408 [Kitasatospora purpeofusca]
MRTFSGFRRTGRRTAGPRLTTGTFRTVLRQDPERTATATNEAIEAPGGQPC